ncbi:MAG: cobalt ECF transporter T component CbiQ [Myxococcota bacterium]|nr:cobalt ECF transporter T component CbiQ [Myxococcota bacterium]
MSGMHLLRSYAHLDSPIHRAPATAKLLTTLALVLGLALLPVAYAVCTLGVLVVELVVAGVARLPLSAFLARLALAQPFVLAIAILALFQGRGFGVFVALALKSTACVAAVQLLAQTTPFQDLLHTLRRAHVPSALLVTMSLLHRYLFLLVDESERMRRARRARTWRGKKWATWKALSSVIAVSFVRALTRADRIAAAMRARGGS